MRVVIVARTRRGTGACIGGITQLGHSVRLIAADAEHNEHAGLEYQVGEVWEIESTPDAHLVPPHVENIIVHSARRLRVVVDLEKIIRRLMPPHEGGPEELFDGLLQALPSGALFIAERSGIPRHSTMFWVPDQPLRMDCEGKRIRYRYPTPDGGRLLTFVGFEEPRETIPAGTLLRVSLAHWWRPRERPEEELRCHVQLSGWIPPGTAFRSPAPPGTTAGRSGGEPVAPPTHSMPPEVVAASPDRAREVLKQIFGYSAFLPLQADIVQRVLERKDTLVIMPTGGGKSLCYQLPALLFDGLTVVVSPLIALMQDQVSQLRALGLNAAFLNSTLSNQEYVAIARQVREGTVRILYAAPETLLRPELLVLLEQSRVACFAVDEAHCISEWGHDFRPEYRQIQQVRQRFPGAVCVALTATATARVREDVRRLLGIEAAGEFVASFNRPNLFLAAQPRRDGLGQTFAFLEARRDQSGIIYCSTRKQVNELAAELRARGWSALPYHADLDPEVRRRNQEQFIRDDVKVMVATIAFGMGINKSNVRFVLHFNLPRDLESYYQEIGRAGRDGLPADCLLLHSRRDAVIQARFIDGGAASERPGRQARLDAMLRFAEATGCRRVPLLAYFGESHPPNCGGCDHCRPGDVPAELVDMTGPAQKFLGCARSTGEIFGAAHLIEVLRGGRGARVVKHRHDGLPQHGSGREWSKDQWRELAMALLEHGFLEADTEFGGLRLTEQGEGALNGRKVLVRKPASAQLAAPPAASVGPDSVLLAALKKLRRELADAANLPAYIIFSDRTLLDMATRLPQDTTALRAISGVGEVKLAKYGGAFLHVIRAHTKPVPTATTDTARLTGHHKWQDIGEAFGKGLSVAQLAARFALKPATVTENLHRYFKAGGQLNHARLFAESRLSSTERERVRAAFTRLGYERLAPVHTALEGVVPYEELHLLRIGLLVEANQR